MSNAHVTSPIRILTSGEFAWVDHLTIAKAMQIYFFSNFGIEQLNKLTQIIVVPQSRI